MDYFFIRRAKPVIIAYRGVERTHSRKNAVGDAILANYSCKARFHIH